MPRIEPTKGRIVYYREQREGRFPGSESFVPAMVLKVNDDGSVNLDAVAEDGMHYFRANVPLVQEDEQAPERGGFCHWMPFQVGQASKTEDATAKLKDQFRELSDGVSALGARLSTVEEIVARPATTPVGQADLPASHV